MEVRVRGGRGSRGDAKRDLQKACRGQWAWIRRVETVVDNQPEADGHPPRGPSQQHSIERACGVSMMGVWLVLRVLGKDGRRICVWGGGAPI